MELRQYGVATTIFFPLIDKGGTDLESTPVTIAAGDLKISKDGGAFANTTTASFTHVGGGVYSIPLTATEMEAKQIIIKVVDQTGTKEWEDQIIIITTCKHASAEIPTFAPTAIENADALLTRDLDQVEASAPIHSATSAFLKLVSRFVAGTGRTYRTNGTTVHMTQTPTTDSAADPVTELAAGA